MDAVKLFELRGSVGLHSPPPHTAALVRDMLKEDVCALENYQATACEWLCKVGLAREVFTMRSRQASRDLFEGRRVIEARWYTATPALFDLARNELLADLGLS